MQLLVETIETSLSAYEAFCRFRQQTSVAFLDSLPGYGDLGRFSILGLNPYLTLRGWQNHCLLNGRLIAENPFDLLDRLLGELRTDAVHDLPLAGGCMGMIAYDAGFCLVDLPLPERVTQALTVARPLVSFDFYDNFLIFDHQSGTVRALACGQLAPANESLAGLRCRLNENAQTVMNPAVTRAPADRSVGAVNLPDESEYLAKVETIRSLISQGEVYIANLTDQLTARATESAESLYHRLRQLNPAPFAAFVRQGELEVLSASPERLFRIRPADGRRSLETCPIKGTRPRGRTPAEDEQNARALLDSGKDRSELLMIVDLERNDLSRICRPESVMVPELFRLETYPTVFHLVATVRWVLRDEVSAVDCLRAIFPGGSITGAPKVAAMQIIDCLESQPRYLYTGCLGYFSLDGQADFNILIRSMVKQGQDISYGSGGGITWESAAREEYQEMLVKAGSFRQVMKGEVSQHAVDEWSD